MPQAAACVGDPSQAVSPFPGCWNKFAMEVAVSPFVARVSRMSAKNLPVFFLAGHRIRFQEIQIHGVDLNGYVLFHTARNLYEGTCRKNQLLELVIREMTEERQVLEDYHVNNELLADHECRYLYVQGATDCVRLLKKLGAL